MGKGENLISNYCIIRFKCPVFINNNNNKIKRHTEKQEKMAHPEGEKISQQKLSWRKTTWWIYTLQRFKTTVLKLFNELKGGSGENQENNI